MSNLNHTLARYFPNPGNFEEEDFLYAFGDARQVLLAFRVYWPELVRVQGHVVLKSYVDTEDTLAGCQEGLRQQVKPAQEFLAGYRWVEVAYLFREDHLTDDDDRVLAELMAETWLGALRLFAPEVSWRTRTLAPTETGGTWGVGFDEQAPVSP